MADPGIIVLAAGSASRMGRPKQLLDFQGQPLIRHAAAEALASGCATVVVVCGAVVEPVRDALHGLPVLIEVNPLWEQGMGSSIQSGLRRLTAEPVSGAILALADQPFVARDFYRRLIAARLELGQPLVCARYAGTFGVPALFDRSFFPHLMELDPSQGCKGVLQRFRAQATFLECPEAAEDIDTPQDYARLMAHRG